MYEVKIETHFSAAHFLRDYNGKCEALHGHNYRVFASARGDVLDDGGMLVDFSLLKHIINSVCDTLDHKCLNDIEAFENNPSAERVAKYIFDEAEAKALKARINGATLFCVEVYETDTSCARYVKTE